MSSLNTYLLHLPVRKSVSIGACLIVIVYILTNSGQIIQTAKYPPLLAPESDVDIIFSHSSTPTVDPDWCDPSTYPPDSLEHLLLAPQANKDPVWGAENHLQFKSWCSCRQTHSCKPNQNEVVLLNVNHFQTWYKNSIDSNNGGETVWGVSIIESLRLLGYTFFYVDTFSDLKRFYHVFSPNVLAIIMSDEHVYECWNDQKNCVKSPENPLGPPIWKIFTFHFWTTAHHPLGHPWTLAPEDYSLYREDRRNANTYLGYSVEPSCNSQPVVPQNERARGSVYAMTKCVSYFAPQPERAWPPSFYRNAAQRLGVHFTIGAMNVSDPQRCGGSKELDIPQLDDFGGDDVMTNLGLLDRPDFVRKVAESNVLLGVGRPYISPTPYQALCVGVPFINPILEWDSSRPEYRGAWNTQHNGLRDLDPPYVYNVFKDDEEGLLNAISQAMRHPISRFIPPGLSLKDAADRLNTILRRNWMRAAEKLLEERIRNEGEIFTL